jgi:glycosyltransferase involved in cell wall biosynthesis
MRSIPELAMHALAQLPTSVRLDLGPTSSRAMLDLTARAYGIRNRVAFDDELDADSVRFMNSDGPIDAATLQPHTLGELVERIGNGSPSVLDDSLDSVLSGHQVLILTNYPAHYRLPLFEQMSIRLSKIGANVHVLFLAGQAKSRPWLTGSRINFAHETLPSLQLPAVDRGLLIPVRLGKRVRRLSPTIVLASGFSPFVASRAARAAQEVRASFGIWSGETAAMPTARQASRERIRRHLTDRSDFAIAYGARAATYLRSLARALPLVIGRNTAPVTKTVDDPPRRSSDQPLRLLLVGDLASPRKGADVALEAMHHVATSDVRLNIVGGGRLQAALERSATADNRVRLLGPLPPADVARELRNADALLFPTRADVFGLVLVEAMGAGVAPIVSRAAGAVDDLAVNGHNAIVVDDHEPATWAKAIDQLVSNPSLATGLGVRARRTIETRWTIDHAVDAMIAGLRLGALTRKERSPA